MLLPLHPTHCAPSRRACNLSYVLWVTAQCGATLILLLVTDIVTTALASTHAARHSVPLTAAAAAVGFRVPLAFNRNMLALFLVANLATGAVNLSIDTMAVGDDAARSIVGECVLLALGCLCAMCQLGCW